MAAADRDRLAERSVVERGSSCRQSTGGGHARACPVSAQHKGSGVVEVHAACHKKELPLELSQFGAQEPGTNTNNAVPADGATCTLGQILLTASPLPGVVAAATHRPLPVTWTGGSWCGKPETASEPVISPCWLLVELMNPPIESMSAVVSPGSWLVGQPFYWPMRDRMVGLVEAIGFRLEAQRRVLPARRWSPAAAGAHGRRPALVPMPVT
jgi:hypothetical protein